MGAWTINHTLLPPLLSVTVACTPATFLLRPLPALSTCVSQHSTAATFST
jgi:hypothetical protein